MVIPPIDWLSVLTMGRNSWGDCSLLSTRRKTFEILCNWSQRRGGRLKISKWRTLQLACLLVMMATLLKFLFPQLRPPSRWIFPKSWHCVYFHLKPELSNRNEYNHSLISGKVSTIFQWKLLISIRPGEKTSCFEGMKIFHLVLLKLISFSTFVADDTPFMC